MVVVRKLYQRALSKLTAGKWRYCLKVLFGGSPDFANLGLYRKFELGVLIDALCSLFPNNFHCSHMIFYI